MKRVNDSVGSSSSSSSNEKRHYRKKRKIDDNKKIDNVRDECCIQYKTGDCYCSLIEKKKLNVANNFLKHTKKVIISSDDDIGGGGGGGDEKRKEKKKIKAKEEDEKEIIHQQTLDEINHVCTLKGTHAMDSYFSSKIRASPGSDEEYKLNTMDMNNLMNKVIDSVPSTTLSEYEDDDDIFKEFYALETSKLLPSTFDLYELMIDTKDMTKETFTKWYDEWKIFNENKKAQSVHASLERDHYILKEEEQRETIRISDSITGARVDVTIENYVFSTHFRNKYTGEHYRFNLPHLATSSLGDGVSFTKTKFAKIDNRTPWGSQLIFESGGMIETGAKKAEISTKLLEHTLNKLKYEYGYKNIEIESRKCENVVATGQFNFNVCLNLLDDKYPFVTYYPDSFTGAIIRMVDVNKYKHLLSNDTFIDFDPDDDEEYEIKNDGFIPSPSLSSKKHSIPNDQGVYSNDEDDIEEEEEEEDYEDFKLKSEYDEDRNISRIDDKIDKNIEAYYEYLKNSNSSNGDEGIGGGGGGGGTDNTLSKSKDNATILIFKRGAFICVGNKKRKEVIKAFAMLLRVFESCRDSPENLIEEKKLTASFLSPIDGSVIQSRKAPPKRKRVSKSNKKSLKRQRTK